MKVTYLNRYLSAARPVTVDWLVTKIRAEKMPKTIRELREEIPYLSPTHNTIFGERIPAVLFPGIYKNEQFIGYTGLVLIEFNRLASYAEADKLKKEIDLYRKPFLVFIGCSGRSVKVVVRYTLPDGTLPVNEAEAKKFHAHAYMRSVLHYQEQFNRRVTIKSYSLAQFCRITWDPECCYHPETIPILLEQPEEMPERKDARISETPSFDPLAGIRPGMKQVERINLLFETCYAKTLDERNKTWEEEDPVTFVHVIGGYCYDSGIPEETAVRWIYNHLAYAGDSVDLIRLAVHNIYRSRKKPPGHRPVMPEPMRLMMQIEEFMKRRYELRFNELTGQVEYRENHPFANKYRPVTIEVMHDICMNGQKEGIRMLDPEVRRYVQSSRVQEYHPLTEFFDSLPEWDGQDRIRELADRVPVIDPLWRDHFYIWFISMVAHWMKRNRMYGNSLVPVLSGGQGYSKSAFFRNLLPPALQDYYIENINLENRRETELLMAQNLLINIDEFDRVSRKHQADLKQLIQTPELKIRKAYEKSFRLVRRMSSFCATANPAELLTDPTGNRRYICVRLTGPIHIQTPIEYEQLYAQAARAIRQGEQYWLSTEEEERLSKSNQAFLQVPLEIQYTLLYFRKPEPGEQPETYRAAHLLDIVSKRARRHFSKTTEKQYSEWLMAQGFEKKHTRTGNVFEVITI